MPTREIGRRANQRLEELYQRHLPLHEDEIVGYYAPGIGYHKSEISGSEHKRFAICLATTDGDIFYASDHDRPFALQSISKVFVYGMARYEDTKMGRGFYTPALLCSSASFLGLA